MIKNEKYIKLFKIMKDGGPGSGRKPEGKTRLPSGNNIASRMSGDGYPRPKGNSQSNYNKNDYSEINAEKGLNDFSRYAKVGISNYPNLLKGLTDLLEADELSAYPDEAAEYKTDRLSNKCKSMYEGLKNYMNEHGMYDDGDDEPDIKFEKPGDANIEEAIKDIYKYRSNRNAPPSQRTGFGMRRNDKYSNPAHKRKTGWTSAGYINPDGSVPSNGSNW